MFAISHAAAALVIKKRYREVPTIWLLLGVQAVEFLWVALNLLGVERVITEDAVRSVSDIHLAHMPYSHSVATTLALSLAAWLVIGRWMGRRRAGIAVALAVASHLVLDIATHARDLPLAPGVSGPLLGSGLYDGAPQAAMWLELTFGVLCWRVYRGGWGLLAVIVGFNLANVTLFSADIVGIEGLLANRPTLIVLLIGAQIAVTLSLVGRLSGRRGEGDGPGAGKSVAHVRSRGGIGA